MHGARVRVEALLHGVQEIVVGALLFLRSELKDCKEDIT